MFAPSYFGKLLGCKSHTIKQPKAVEFAFKAICSRFGHFSAESDWIIRVALLYYLLHKPDCIFKSDVKIQSDVIMTMMLFILSQRQKTEQLKCCKVYVRPYSFICGNKLMNQRYHLFMTTGVSQG